MLKSKRQHPPEINPKYWGKDTYNPEKPTIFKKGWYIIRVKISGLKTKVLEDIFDLYTKTSDAISYP